MILSKPQIFYKWIFILMGFLFASELQAKDLRSHIVQLTQFNEANQDKLVDAYKRNDKYDDPVAKGYILLDTAVEAAVAEKVDSVQVAEIFETVYLLLEADPTQHAVEVVYKLYHKETQLCLKHLDTLPARKQELIKGAIKNYVKLLREGNG